MDDRDFADMEKEAADRFLVGWYCPNCGEIDGRHVTYDEHCDICGAEVE